MKNFDEFSDFLLGDCRHEINDIGNSLGDVFTDEDFDTIGMSEEALGTLMRVHSYVVSRTVMLMLRRYHEWNESFPEAPQDNHLQ